MSISSSSGRVILGHSPPIVTSTPTYTKIKKAKIWAVFIFMIWANLPLSSAAVVVSEMIPAFASASVTFRES